METFCSRCKAPMSCEREKGCWCAEFPNILPIPDSKAEGCLCRDCLSKQLELHAAHTPNLSDVR